MVFLNIVARYSAERISSFFMSARMALSSATVSRGIDNFCLGNSSTNANASCSDVSLFSSALMWELASHTTFLRRCTALDLAVVSRFQARRHLLPGIGPLCNPLLLTETLLVRYLCFCRFGEASCCVDYCAVREG